uniref:Transferred entry: 7.1.1.8 n=2 Tax=Steinernema glaseri TaxID=37863 RepID=A0A1I8A9A2_9BILA
MGNQTKTIRRVLDDIMGGMWGVLVSDDDAEIYWTLPDVRPFFCRHTFHRWHYVAFKTNDQDTGDRYLPEDAIKESRLLKILSRKPRDYHDERNPCDPPIPGSVILRPQDNYIVRRPDY